MSIADLVVEGVLPVTKWTYQITPMTALMSLQASTAAERPCPVEGATADQWAWFQRLAHQVRVDGEAVTAAELFGWHELDVAALQDGLKELLEREARFRAPPRRPGASAAAAGEVDRVG